MICLCAHVGTWTFCKIDMQEKHGLIVIETVIETVIEIVIKIVASCIPISLFASRPAAALSLSTHVQKLIELAPLFDFRLLVSWLTADRNARAVRRRS